MAAAWGLGQAVRMCGDKRERERERGEPLRWVGGAAADAWLTGCGRRAAKKTWGSPLRSQLYQAEQCEQAVFFQKKGQHVRSIA